MEKLLRRVSAFFTVIAVAGVLAFGASQFAVAQFPGLLPSGNVWGNATAGRAAAAPSTMAAMLNRAFCTPTNQLLGGASAWGCVGLGGTLAFSGSNIQTGAGTGDVTWAANSFATTISAAAVSYAKMQNVAASRLLGNPTGAPASPSEIGLGATLAFSGSNIQTNAFTGDVTTAANSFATTIASSAVTNAKMANMAATTIKGNATGGAAAPQDLTPGQVGGMLCSPVVNVFTSGSALTYTTPTCNTVRAQYLTVEMVGGGAGGAGSGGTAGNGGAGGASSFGTSLLTAGGGTAGQAAGNTTAAGGTASGCDINQPGGIGGAGSSSANGMGGHGGISFLGGAGPAGTNGSAAAGQAAATNSGSGGGGASDATATGAGGGGGSGAYCWKMLAAPNATYSYTVGTAGSAGAAGTSGAAGGAGSAGLIKVVAYFQ